jgi:peptide-methionine (R)-S-oxide reductase
MSDQPVKKSDAEWQAQLTAPDKEPLTYRVTRQAATEPPFTGRYWDHFESGDYKCVCCGVKLFASDTKFDAGCGWPSYWQPTSNDLIEYIRDTSHGMIRTEVRCKSCGAHLGHVFDDGPQPTGERYCINSAAIDFEPNPR